MCLIEVLFAIMYRSDYCLVNPAVPKKCKSESAQKQVVLTNAPVPAEDRAQNVEKEAESL